jgi:Ca2+-binding RTX toxin-like protein
MDMAEATAREQLILELVNRARMDPAGEAARFKIGLNDGLAAGTLNGVPKQVLAFNSALNTAADRHSQWMLDTDSFSHTGVGGSDPGDRMGDAGYSFTGSWTWGENIAWTGSTGPVNGDADAAQHHKNLFLSAGHRENILNDDFREIGVGTLTGKFLSGGTNWNALMTTQDFARTGTAQFVTGVCYRDADRNDFYSIGEGQGGIKATLLKNGTMAGSADSQTAGGYAIGTGQTGACELRYSGGPLSSPVGVAFNLGSSNLKVDLVNNDTIDCNVSARLTGKAVGLDLLGIQNISATGNDLANTISGNSGNNVVRGQGGGDRMTGSGGSDLFDFRAASHCKGDVITDFNVANDRLSFSAIDAIAGGADSAFTFDGAAFDGQAGSLCATLKNGNTLVQGDINGDGIADFVVTLLGTHALTAGDFIL